MLEFRVEEGSNGPIPLLLKFRDSHDVYFQF